MEDCPEREQRIESESSVAEMRYYGRSGTNDYSKDVT